MTDITDQDLCKALAWAEGSMARGGADAAARVILATVEAPEPTLAEELRDVADNYGMSSRAAWRLDDIADRVEHDLAEARAEVERLTAERVTDPSPTLNDGSMTRPATVAREENVAPDQQGDPLPAPADVPEGQAWIVKVDQIEPTVGFSTNGTGWCCYRSTHGTALPVGDERITLVSRLMPAPRQITTRGELNALPEGTVVRAKGELVCERYRHRSKGLVWISTGVDEDFPVDRPVLPATVLWTPEETK